MRLIDVDALKKDWNMANRCEDCPRDARDCQYGMVLTRMDVCQMLDDAPTVGGWVSVQDRLPDGECIAYSTKWFEMIIGYVYKATASDTGYEAESENEVLRDVTHWMPLPEPPKEVSKHE